ncbi:MAG: DUF1298 domain-containing protein, partial [Acidimicrobiales bacterium]|nr:DUF1298 domain-containing protein [Acidimicrobiales bacterium]
NAAVPVSIRGPGEDRAWGNRMTSWVVGLGTDHEDPLERLATVRHHTAVAKRIDAQRDLTLQHDWMDYWPLFKIYTSWLPALGQRFTGHPSYSLIASSVPGPRTPLYRDGARLAKIISMGPLLFPFGLNFTGWSYVDDLTIGVVACREHVPDIWHLANGLTLELEELAGSVG